MKTIETARLLLRGFAEDDASDVYAYATSPRVGPAAGWKPHESAEESLSIVRRFIKEDDVWAIVDRESGRVIGSLGLHLDGRQRAPGIRSLGYALAENHWGRGFATEAAKAALAYHFETTDAPLVSVYHYPFNSASRRVIEKCGFRYEGTLRMAVCLYNGEVHDSLCYSMTRQEYDALKAKGRFA